MVGAGYVVGAGFVVGAAFMVGAALTVGTSTMVIAAALVGVAPLLGKSGLGGAAAVVGYHGAGVTNSLFMPNQACVTEMSAYCDAEHRTVWRNCGECVTQWTPWLRWKLHKIPFRDMLEANGLAPTATVPADRDSWLKNLLYVGVRPEEMGRIVDDVHACLEGLPGGAGPANLAHNERGNRGMSSAELMQPQERCPGAQPRPLCWDGMQGPPWCRGVQPPKVQ